MSHRSTRIRLFLAGCLLIGSLGLYGQTLGSIAGQVRDSSGAAVPETKVTAINTGTNAQRAALSNEAGDYAFPLLPPGIYTVTAERPGFKTLVRTQVEIQVQQNARIDFELQVGLISESVEVAANAVIRSASGDTGVRGKGRGGGVSWIVPLPRGWSPALAAFSSLSLAGACPCP